MKRAIGMAAFLLLAAVATSTSCTHTAHSQEPATTPPGGTVQPADIQPAPAAAEPTRRVVDYKNPTLEDILDAWKQREKKVKNIKIVWDEEVRRFAPPKIVAAGKTTWQSYPKKDETEYKKGSSFAFDGLKFSLNSPSRKYNDPSETILVEWERSDGVSYSSFNPWGLQAGGGTGIIRETADFEPIARTTIAPLMALYRPLYQASRKPRSLSESGGDLSSLGLSIEMYATDPEWRIITIGDKSHRYAYKVELQPGFPVTGIRSEWRNRNPPNAWHTSTEIKVVIEKHDVLEFVPREWTTQHYHQQFDFVTNRTHHKATAFSANTPLPDAEFDPLAFPVGTLVEDRRPASIRKQAGGGMDGKQFWQRENGVLEPFDQDVANAKAEAAWKVENEAEKQRLQGSYFHSTSFLLLQIGAFLVLFVIWCFQRRK